MQITNDNFTYSNEAYQKNLAIIVPYRDRGEHLSQFLPHMLKYFHQSTFDKKINFSIHIVEQANNKPFNRGALKNAGFQLTRDHHDYYCLHDIDYLPIWANYAFPESPTRLIWNGLVPTPPTKFFGGVILLKQEHFLMINGYPNTYLGWGYEDEEIRDRCVAAGLTPHTRNGTYQALSHKSDGFKSLETLEFSDAAIKNRDHYRSRKDNLSNIMKSDGLSTLNFKLINSNNVNVNGEFYPNIHLHQVDF